MILATTMFSLDARWVAAATAVLLVMAESRDDADAFRRSWAPSAARRRYWNFVVVNALVTAFLVFVAVPEETLGLLRRGPIVLGVVVGVGWGYAGTRVTGIATELARSETSVAPVAQAVNSVVLRWDINLENTARHAVVSALNGVAIEEAARLLRSAAVVAYPLELASNGEARPHPNRAQVDAFVDAQLAACDHQGIVEYGSALILQERIRKDRLT